MDYHAMSNSAKIEEIYTTMACIEPTISFIKSEYWRKFFHGQGFGFTNFRTFSDEHLGRIGDIYSRVLSNKCCRFSNYFRIYTRIFLDRSQERRVGKECRSR